MTSTVHPEMAAAAQAFFDQQAPLSALRGHLEAGPGYDAQTWRRYCTELEGGRLLLPAEVGGLGAGIREASVVAEAAGRVLYGGPYLAQWLAGLLLLGADQDPGPSAASGLLSEVAAGRTVVALSLDPTLVRARRGPDGWRLVGDKCPLEHLDSADVLLVAARVDTADATPAQSDEVALFLVQPDADGLHRHDVDNLDLTRRTGLARLRDTPATRLISAAAGAGVAQRLTEVATTATVLRAAENLGSLRRLHGITTAYALAREQFGRTIASFQAVKHNLADRLVEIEAATAAVDAAVRLLAEQPGSPGAEAAVLTAGLVTEDAFARMAHEGIQLHGGIGFTWEHDAHLFYRRAAAGRGVAGARSVRLGRLLDLTTVADPIEDGVPTAAPLETPELAAFRARARAWLTTAIAAGEAPEVRPGPVSTTAEGLAAGKRHQAALHEAGFSGITYPREYGGAGLPAPYEDAFFEETRATGAGEDKLFRIGIAMIGPAILAMGTPEQRDRYLPPLLRGEEVWCELFSEPGSGSDMAGARTRAVPDGDGYLVTGQKVWTSNGHLCDFGLLLARTDPTAAKHAGLSMFVVPMDAPGVEVRPLRQITGETDFNEVFLDEVRLPRESLLGGLNDGWRVARLVLQHERMAMGTTAVRRVTLADLVELAAGRGTDPLVRAGLAEQALRERALRTYLEYLAGAEHRHRLPAEAGAVAKLLMTGTMHSASTLAVELLEGGSAVWPRGSGTGDLLKRVLAAQAFSIAGGTDNILRNLVGERALGLPRD
ncbi:acyl-CoA dehydrogenase [Nocardioides houyundeii]|uniref:acyl-CoA dehydrogenase n=1 Tax=Nocardioides houyundeii TaxID=2045452 RepID=UPI000DF24A7C|nr:acyl-CoA dehydrogenase [Nocardioides houyundeii]